MRSLQSLLLLIGQEISILDSHWPIDSGIQAPNLSTVADTNYAVTKGARTGIPAIEGPLKHLIMTLSAQGKTLF